MECPQIRERLGRYIDNELSDDEKKAVQEHLSICPDCAAELETLMSIHAAGRTDYIPEPEPRYWKQLTRDIRGRIAELEEKPAESTGFLDRVKNIFWPKSIGYRLVGLTATAMIVLVVIHYTFFREGKFDLPVDMTGKETAPTADKAKAVPEIIKEDESGRQVTQTPPIPATTEAVPTGREQERTPSSVPAEPLATKEEPVGQEKELLEEKAVAVPKKGESSERIDRSEDAQPAPVEHEEADVAPLARPAAAERKAADARAPGGGARVLRTKLAADDSAEQEAEDYAVVHATFLREAQSTDDISEKIRVWETYLQASPASPWTIKAKVELAKLYYQLAKEKKTEVTIRKALQFYEENRDQFESEDSDALLKKQMEELNRLLEEIEKK